MRPLLIATAAVALVAAACGNGDDVADPTPPPVEQQPGAPEIVSGELHECAEELPVPDQLSVLTSGSTPAEGGAEICITTLDGDESFEVMTAAYRTTLDEAGWEHSVEEEEPDVANVLRMTSPECGFLLVVDGVAATELGLVEPQAEVSQTITVAQIMDCDLLPPPPA
jgi:hypothetical protein